MADVLVGRNDYVERRRFRRLQKVSVFKLRRPAPFDDRADLMSGEESAHPDRNVLVKQDAQRGGCERRK